MSSFASIYVAFLLFRHYCYESVGAFQVLLGENELAFGSSHASEISVLWPICRCNEYAYMKH